MIHVEEINDIQRLADDRLLWNALLPQTPGGKLLHSPRLARTLLAALRRPAAAADADRPRRSPAGGNPPPGRASANKRGWATCGRSPIRCTTGAPFYGPIGPNPTATLLAGLRHIARNPPRLGHARPPLGQCQRLRSRPRASGQWSKPAFVLTPKFGNIAPRIELDGSWEDYWNGRDKKWRHNVERCSRRLHESGEVSFIRYRPQGAAAGDGDPRWDLYDACVELAARSWQGGGGETATLSSPGVRQFLRDVHAAAARSGNVDLNLLLLDGRPVAFAYNYICDGQIYGLRKGFDPDFSTLRPGATLDKMMLEDGFRRDNRSYDLGVGSLEVKAPWQTSVATSYRLTHFPAAISRVQLLRLKRWLSGKGILPASPKQRLASAT